MSTEIYLGYFVTVLLLMSTPGPSHLLMLSNSMSHGFNRSWATAFGDLTANLLQMLAAGIGLAAVLVSSAQLFNLVKWFGVAYLVWLGVKLIRSKAIAGSQSSAPLRSKKQLWWQGFVTSAANPKAVVFFAALFPQFIDQSQAFWPQFSILAATYLLIDGVFLTGYGVAASWLGQRLEGAGRVWLDRLGGGFLIGAAILLGLRSIDAQR